jgi:hypothetical protein
MSNGLGWREMDRKAGGCVIVLLLAMGLVFLLMYGAITSNLPTP